MAASPKTPKTPRTLKDVSDALRSDFVHNFPKFLATVVLLAVVVPLFTLVTIPVVMLVTAMVPFLILMLWVCSPIVLLAAVVLTYNYSDEIGRARNYLYSRKLIMTASPKTPRTPKDVSDALRSDFVHNFPKFLATVVLLAVVVPLGFTLVTIPVVMLVTAMVPFLILMLWVCSPIVLLAAVVLTYNYSDEIGRARNYLYSVHYAVAYYLLSGFHPLLALAISVLSPRKSPSPQLRALGAIVQATRQRGPKYTLDMFRKACDGYSILFWYKKPAHRDVWSVTAENPSRQVRCHYMRTALEPEGSPPLIFYLHGGGFVAGSAGVYRGMISPVATKLNSNVFAVEYRKMPEHPLPAAVNDAVAAYRYLTVDKGVNPRKIVFAGDSAGGCLCLLTLLEIQKQPDLQQPAGAMLMSPYVDITISTDSWVRNRGKDFILEPRIIDAAREMFTQSPNFTLEEAKQFSPALFPVAAFEGLPPLFVSASTTEPLIDEINIFLDKLRSARVPVTAVFRDNCPHVFQMFYRWCPEAKEVMDQGIEFLKECLVEDS
ncbi:Esterase [Diplonema papillatum]|nr:Esterase [Diplonema papillatum]